VLDLRPEPELGPTTTEIHDGSGHVHVAVLIDADRVGMGEAEDAGHIMSVDEVFGSNDRRHALRLLRGSDPSDRSVSFTVYTKDGPGGAPTPRGLAET